MEALAREATLGSRKGFESPPFDPLSAIYAHAVCSDENATQCCVDLTNLFHFPRDLRKIGIDENVGERLLFGVMDLPNELTVGLRIASEQGSVNPRLQGAQPRPQSDFDEGHVQVCACRRHFDDPPVIVIASRVGAGGAVFDPRIYVCAPAAAAVVIVGPAGI